MPVLCRPPCPAPSLTSANEGKPRDSFYSLGVEARRRGSARKACYLWGNSHLYQGDTVSKLFSYAQEALHGRLMASFMPKSVCVHKLADDF